VTLDPSGSEASQASTSRVLRTQSSLARERPRRADAARAAGSEASPSGEGRGGEGEVSGSAGRGSGSGFARAGSAQGGLAPKGPRLVAPGGGCSDLFPYGARDARADVRVQLAVATDGRARYLRMLSTTAEDDYSLAARACSSRLRFSPARDESGRAVEARVVVELHFERAS